MTLGCRAANTKILCKQGSDWQVRFQIRDQDGVVVPLAGSSFAGQIRRTRKGSVIAASFTFAVDTGTNTVTVSLAKATTAAMTAGERETDPDSIYWFDWEWTKADSTVDRIIEGMFVLSAEVTR